VLAAVLLIAGIFVFIGGKSDKAAASGEVFLEGNDQVGTSSFTPSIAAPKPAATAPNATETPTPSNGGTIKTSGGQPGLYGGQRDVPSCNASALVSYLGGKPDVAKPWAAALAIGPGDVAGYVATLTPALTRVDMRVTDFGLAKGKAVPRQSTLQAGTAVLLDRGGFPRVRCASGNPLGEPQAVTSAPRYAGPRWPGYSPSTVVVVTPAPTTNVIILIDVVTGDPFARVPGSVVIIDIDRPADGAVVLLAEAGGPARITGINWPPGTAVTAYFDAPDVALGADFADGGGNVTINVTILREAVPGPHTVTVNGGGIDVPETIYVLPPAVGVRA
jgi:uncharacterized protein DUF6777